MTVKQLTELLQTMPEYAKVQCRDNYGSWDDITWYNPHSVKLEYYDDSGDQIVPDADNHRGAVAVIDLVEV